MLSIACYDSFNRPLEIIDEGKWLSSKPIISIFCALGGRGRGIAMEDRLLGVCKFEQGNDSSITVYSKTNVECPIDLIIISSQSSADEDFIFQLFDVCIGVHT